MAQGKASWEAGLTCPHLRPRSSKTASHLPGHSGHHPRKGTASTGVLCTVLSVTCSKGAPAAWGVHSTSFLAFHGHMHKRMWDAPTHLPPPTWGHATVLGQDGHLEQPPRERKRPTGRQPPADGRDSSLQFHLQFVRDTAFSPRPAFLRTSASVYSFTEAKHQTGLQTCA